MGARFKGRASLEALREAYSEAEEAAGEELVRPALLGIGRVANVEEEQSFEGRTMGVGVEELAAVVVGRAGDGMAPVRAGAVFETTRGSNTDIVWLIPWESRPVTLGRNRDNDVVVPEYSISGEHCRFRWKGRAGLRIEDSEASNGVWVDGVRLPVGEPRLLEGGEQIVLGRFAFCFLYADDVRRLLRGGDLVDGPDGRLIVREERPEPEPPEEGGGFLRRLFGRKR